MHKKIALITGITGQDGSYLAELLLKKKYVIHGIIRRSSSFNTNRIDHIYQGPFYNNKSFFIHYGDLTDASFLNRIIAEIKPHEIYNLAAQSHVKVSFDMPDYTTEVNSLGTLRILEAIKNSNLIKKTKFYQASTSELYGGIYKNAINENFKFYPKSPYGVSKLYSYWITKVYKESYGLFACNGILFNHESPRRGETFVTRKITKGLVNVYLGKENCIYLGNLDSQRDWGHARDYVYMQWLMLQQKKPDDYIISFDKKYSIRDFILQSGRFLGFDIAFKGKGMNEIGYIKNITNNSLNIDSKIKIGKTIIRVNKKYFRPNEVDVLLGNSSKARRNLKWIPKTSFKELVEEMMISDFKKESEN